MWHLIHSWPIFAQLLPDIHFLLHFGHLYSPKQRFFPWYGVSPSPFGRAWGQSFMKCPFWKQRWHRYVLGSFRFATFWLQFEPNERSKNWFSRSANNSLLTLSYGERNGGVTSWLPVNPMSPMFNCLRMLWISLNPPFSKKSFPFSFMIRGELESPFWDAFCVINCNDCNICAIPGLVASWENWSAEFEFQMSVESNPSDPLGLDPFHTDRIGLFGSGGPIWNKSRRPITFFGSIN